MSWPDPSAMWQGAKAAGGWLRDKAAAAGQAGVDRARQLATAAEAKARQLAAAADAKARQLAAAAEAKARQAAAAAERIAREKVRAAQAAVVDELSGPVASGSDTYQRGKAQVLGARDKVTGAYGKAKEMFGLAPPSPTTGCKKSGRLGDRAADGSFLVPTEACPADSIPVGDDGVAPAYAKAKAASVSSTSKCCAAQPPAVRNRTVVYVNGIMTTPEKHCNTLRLLKDMTCGKVVGILNDTENENIAIDSIRTADARQMIKNEIGGNGTPRDYPGFSPSVKTMRDVMVLEATGGGNPQIIAHSEGGAITSLAAIRAKKVLAGMDEAGAMRNLDITSMGSAAPAWPDGPNYTHYIHLEDVVPNTLGLGDAARRPGAGAEVIRFGGRNGDWKTEQPGDMRPWIPITPGKDKIADHYADTSYLPYMNRENKGCLGKD